MKIPDHSLIDESSWLLVLFQSELHPHIRFKGRVYVNGDGLCQPGYISFLLSLTGRYGFTHQSDGPLPMNGM